MKNLTEIVISYEKSRKILSGLHKKRAKLINDCTGPINTSWTGDDNFISKTEGFGSSCFEFCNKHIVRDYHDPVTFDDNLDEHGCGNCQKARAVTVSEMPDVKHDFGMAKRSLSAYGKKLIKESEL